MSNKLTSNSFTPGQNFTVQSNKNLNYFYMIESYVKKYIRLNPYIKNNAYKSEEKKTLDNQSENITNGNKAKLD